MSEVIKNEKLKELWKRALIVITLIMCEMRWAQVFLDNCEPLSNFILHEAMTAADARGRGQKLHFKI